MPLAPRYVSSVDSGNLAGHLLTLRPGLAALIDAPILNRRWLEGISDTFSDPDRCRRQGFAGDRSPIRAVRNGARIGGRLPDRSRWPTRGSKWNDWLRAPTMRPHVSPPMPPIGLTNTESEAGILGRRRSRGNARTLRDELDLLAPWLELRRRQERSTRLPGGRHYPDAPRTRGTRRGNCCRQSNAARNDGATPAERALARRRCGRSSREGAERATARMAQSTRLRLQAAHLPRWSTASSSTRCADNW